MNRINLLLCIHNHQPVGNFDFIVEEAYQKSYKPFIDLLYEYPDIKMSLHYSGILWDYFLQKHTDFIEKVKEMVKRKQVEIFSGGYYEPILSSIPQKDRVSQIMMMNEFVQKTFGVYPKGLWLTERVWEQSIVKDIVNCGLQYTLVDDYIFYMAGINKLEEQYLTDYYITEEEGKILYVFPILQILRYYIPFRTVEDNMKLFETFKQKKDKENLSLTMGDDGEKFGIWPKTYEHVYENKWLKNFFEALIKNKDWLSTSTFSEYINIKKPRGRIYLPTASYFEMGEWTLPTSTQILFENLIKHKDEMPNSQIIQQFLHGGYWKNFFAKYPEANNMHKKMLYLSFKLEESKNKELLQNLFKAQCNCAYWHGVFGGLYLPHLREAIYENLIEIEKQIIDEGIIEEDFDKDSENEIAIHSKDLGVYIKPSYGGSIFEMDIKKVNKNLCNVLTRRKEAYHNRLLEFEKNNLNNKINSAKTIHDIIMTKEQNLYDKIYYDWHNRYSFLDHFISVDTTFEDFRKSHYKDLGNFTLEKYELKKINRKSNSLILFRSGSVWIDNQKCDININKKYILKNNILSCEYKIENIADRKISLQFLVDLNFLIFNEDLLSPRIEDNTESVYLKDTSKNFLLKISTSQPIQFWFYPIQTVSLSEAGFEKNYQGVCVTCNFKLSLESLSEYKDFLEIAIE